MASDDYGSVNFYAGADYGLDSEYGGDFTTQVFPDARYPASQFGFTTDPRTANQLKAVSDKLNTGAKTIEVTGVSAAEWEAVPEQHLKEIERLKKLAGIDLTFHGPLVEPTGVTKTGWNESHREQAERQMAQAVERAHKMDSEGNIVVTFHSSSGLPDPETKVVEEYIDKDTGEKKTREKITEFWVVSKDGQFQSVIPKPDYFKGREVEWESVEQQGDSIKAAIEKQNKDAWARQLQGVNYHATIGSDHLQIALSGKHFDVETKKNIGEKEWLTLYSGYLKGEGIPQLLEKVDDPYKDIAKKQLRDIEQSHIYLKDAYQDLQTLFNQAYDVARKNDNKNNLKRLDAFRGEIKGTLGNIEDPSKLREFGDEILKGVHVLNSIEPPENLKPLRDFAIDKSSDTFANVAYNSYKKFGDTSPIISIENPPVGMGLTRAEDLRNIVEESYDKLLKGRSAHPLFTSHLPA